MESSEELQKDGGQAFPETGNHGQHVPGMTPRDFFAAQAMVGICAHPDTWGLTPEGIAYTAYEMAAHMLAARPEEQES